MTRIVSMLCAVLLTLFATACGRTPPDLPPKSPSDVHRILTGDSATDFLNAISTYPWDDDGAIAGERFTWIGRDSSSPNNDATVRASEAAASLADFLLAEHNDLMSVRAGFLGLTRTPAAQLNPELIRSYAIALAPYLGRMVNGVDAGFAALRDTVTNNPAALRNLLTVMMADSEAASTLMQGANDAAGRLEDAATAAPPGSQDSVADLAAAGSLLGATAGAARQARTTGVAPPVVDDASNDMAIRIASVLVRVDPNPGTVSMYVRNGRLMSPDDVEQQFGGDELQSYFGTLTNYLIEKGFGEAIAAFENAFRTSSGEVPQKPTA